MTMLMVDDDLSTLNSLARIFVTRGFRTVSAASLAAAEQNLSPPPDVALLDIHLPDGNGLDMIKTIRARAPECCVIMMTAFADVETAVTALRLGAADYIIKPFELPQILSAVDRGLKRCQALQTDQPLAGAECANFSCVVTRNPGFLRVLDSLRKVCASDTTVLITGESGTGKEVVARAVHANSRRSGRPMVAVNCAAIPATLMETELFGHIRGAFTGAIADSKGYFERANGGTLFLDEIGEIPPDLQVKLLRVLQERQISRVGDGRPMPIDFRLIAATQRNLESDVRTGRFRQDLYYRLNVFPVELPPLRDRPEDIEPLCAHVLRELKRPGLCLSSETLDVLRGHRWPGNVRELANIIERAALMSDGRTIVPADLPPEMTGGRSGIRLEIPADARSYRGVVKEVTDRARREMVARALAQNEGNVTHSARQLGISRRQLINLMRELGMREPPPDEDAD